MMSLPNILECHISPRVKGIMVGIDILPNGSCNLRCPSCPVGNSTFSSGKVMTLDLFRRVLDKLQRETVIREVWTGGYTEPLLHHTPWVFIEELRKRGLRSCLSTNLKITTGLENVVKAKPSLLRVSVSGFTQKYYGYYHGGDIEVVKRNMVDLARWLKEYSPGTDGVVFFHKYKDNRHEAGLMQEYAESLGFRWDWCHAFYRPAEKMVLYLQGGALPVLDTELIDRLSETPQRTLARVAGIKSPCRSHYKQLEIRSDGGVTLCCHAPLTHLSMNYLDMSLKDIRREQRANRVCDDCIGSGLHLLYNNNEAIERG